MVWLKQNETILEQHMINTIMNAYNGPWTTKLKQ